MNKKQTVIKRSTFADFKKKQMKNKKFKEVYEALGPEFEIIQTFIDARKKVYYSQEQLAEKLHVQQPSIARLERGGYSTTSISKLAQIANALGYKMKIVLSPNKKIITNSIRVKTK